jgi:hypothetical protein
MSAKVCGQQKGTSMKISRGLALSLCLVLPTSALADFQYSETTKITGGSLVSLAKFAGAFSKQARSITDPVTSSIYVKGNRMAHIYPDHTEIVDLDQETITHVDPAEKQYWVMTFQEMKQAMEQAMAKAKEAQAQQPQQPANSAPPPDVKFNVSVTNTGASKQVAGLSASESILKMTALVTNQQTNKSGTFAMANDMWMVPEIPGYEEVRDFNRRFAEKMGDMFSGSLPPSMMQPGMGKGMADMAKEMSKLKGVPVSQIMRMGSTADGSPLPAASEAPLPQSNTPTAGQVAGNAANQAATNAANSAANTAASNVENKAASHMGGLGGVASSIGLGGFGGFHKKKPDQQQQQTQSQANAQQNVMVLMESSTETTNFSSAPVDASKFAVPAGYTKVPSEYQKESQKKN